MQIRTTSTELADSSQLTRMIRFPEERDRTPMDHLHGTYKALVLSRSGPFRSRRALSIANLKNLIPASLRYASRRQLRLALREVVTNYGSVKAKHGIGFIRQVSGCIRFARAMQVAPDSYYKHQLFLRENWARRHQYLYHEEICELLEILNAVTSPVDSRDLEDKRRFFIRASQARLPVIPVLAEFDGGKVGHNYSLDNYPRSDLFSKFADRWCGEGAGLWELQPDGSYLDNFGSMVTLSVIHEGLRVLSFQDPVVLQPRVFNHRLLVPISGKALSTVRIVTVRHTNGETQPALACYRMPIGRLIVDNFACGGMAAPIQLDTGRLGPAVFKQSGGTHSTVDVHPDTGAAITGQNFPYWSEVKELAIAAHEEFNTMPSVGWDIAITDSGPILVEGNTVWCVDLAQISHRQPLGETVVPNCLHRYFHDLGLLSRICRTRAASLGQPTYLPADPAS